MLRKRTRSHQKDQHMNNLMTDAISELYFYSDISTHNHKSNSFLKVPGLFVGFNHRSSESDSVRSPTSPLDFRIFSSFGNPFRCPKSLNEAQHKSWDCSKVGLSIIDSLDDETNDQGKFTRSSDNKNILFGRQMSIRSPTFCSRVETPKSLPKDVACFPSTRVKPANTETGNSDVVFEIGEASFESQSYESIRACSVDSGRYRPHLTDFGNRRSRFGSGNLVPEHTLSPLHSESRFLGGSPKLDNYPIPPSTNTDFIGSVPASEIELSEDYTCVRTHGPNPKVTHIFGDCILECHNDEATNFPKNSEDDNTTLEAGCETDVLAYPNEDFLKFCYSCQKQLDGEDIYMYRGEKAFCSYDCRSQEIEIDEETEKTTETSNGSLLIT